MVDPVLQATIEAMSVGERLELIEYIESVVDESRIELAEEQKSLIRSRTADLAWDPSPGLTWTELEARMASWR